MEKQNIVEQVKEAFQLKMTLAPLIGEMKLLDQQNQIFENVYYSKVFLLNPN